MAKERDYAKEYRTYHASEEQKKNRAARNAARAKLAKAGRVKKGDGKDVDHRKMLSSGGTNATSNLRVVDPSKNRGFPRNSDNSPKGNWDAKGRGVRRKPKP